MPNQTVPEAEGALIAAHAEAQHGVVSAAQLYALGLSKDQVNRRVRDGRIYAVHRGVYAVGHRRLTQEGRWMAGVLAAGRGAVLSHCSAAKAWGLVPVERSMDPGGGRRTIAPGVDPDRVHLTRAGRGGRGQPGLVIHRSTVLTPASVTSHAGLPITTPARTLLDVAGVLTERTLERAINEAERLRLCSPDALEELVARHPRRRGLRTLRAALGSRAAGRTLTRSELEERFLALCRQGGLPRPLVNASLHGLTVDFLWAEERVVVEVDGRGSHATRRAFQDDRDRDSLLAVHGFVTLRFTWWDVTRRPAVVTTRLERVLANRRGKA